MSSGALFAVGFAITALVVFAIGGLIYGAILDQRYHEEMTSSSGEDADRPADGP
ncbi:MAG: hypothetical protein ACKOQ0_03840 [Solirubrobacterales bacterium]